MYNDPAIHKWCTKIKYVLYTFIVTINNFTTIGNISDFQNMNTFFNFSKMYFKW